MSTSLTDIRTPGATEVLSRFMVDLSYSDLPSDIQELAKIFILECCGHMVEGGAQPVSKLVIEYTRDLGATPRATIVGAGLRSSVAEAAYANGTIAHADELESYGTLPGTCVIAPLVAALAVGEWKDVRGDELLTAFVAGIEMQGRLGVSGIGACDRGFMGISLVGPAGAGVAAGKLLGLDVEQMQHCLGVALPLSNGSTRGCGYMTHVHEAGVPARAGVLAAELVARGFTGCPDFLDGAFSWGDQYAGDGPRGYAPDTLTDGLGERFFLESAGTAPKKYGACGLTHQTLEGAIDLMVGYSLRPEDIDFFELSIPSFTGRVAGFGDPLDGEQAKFSIPQGIAGLLVDGVPKLPYVTAFTDMAARDERYANARKRVHVLVETNRPNVRGFDAHTVTVVLKDGRRLSKVVEAKDVRGRIANPLSLAERVEMFRNTAEVLEAGIVDRLVNLVLHFEEHSVRELMGLLGPELDYA
jgi:2-methylcitrate dehydratase PrpD